MTTTYDRAHDVDRAREAVALLQRAGRADVAESIDSYLDGVEHYASADDPDPAGWRAFAYFLQRELYDPAGPCVGDRVRLTYADGSGCTGEWHYEPASADYPHGRPYVLRDDDGSHHTHTAGHVRREVTRLAPRPHGWTLDLERAALVVRSAWSPGPRPEDVDLGDDVDPADRDTGCHGCVDGGTACRCAAECTCDVCHHRDYERRRWCACGQPATRRVIAWQPAPQTVVGDPVDADTAASAPRRTDPGEFAEVLDVGDVTVCSLPCARTWITEHRARLAEFHNGALAGDVLYRVEDWAYQPDDADMPRALFDAREHGRRVSYAMAKAAEHWVAGEAVKAANFVTAARVNLAGLLDAMTGINPATREPRRYSAGDPQPARVEQVTSVDLPTAHYYRRTADGWSTFPYSPLGLLGGDLLTWGDVLQLGDVVDHPRPELWPDHPAALDADRLPVELTGRLARRVAEDPGRYVVTAGAVWDHVRQVYLCPARGCGRATRGDLRCVCGTVLTP